MELQITIHQNVYAPFYSGIQNFVGIYNHLIQVFRPCPFHHFHPLIDLNGLHSFDVYEKKCLTPG